MANKRRTGDERLTKEFIARNVGDISDGAMAAIIATRATVEEFEVALRWAEGETDVVGELERPLIGRAGQIYDILSREREMPDEETH